MSIVFYIYTIDICCQFAIMKMSSLLTNPINMRKKDAAKAVFQMLAFQYKPLEKVLKQEFPKLYPRYKKFSYAKKIKVLDMLASDYLGL